MMNIFDMMRVCEGLITDLQGFFDRNVQEAQLLDDVNKQAKTKPDESNLEDEPVIISEINRHSPTMASVDGSQFYGSEKSMNWFLEVIKK